jgi:hypothetical protein
VKRWNGEEQNNKANQYFFHGMVDRWNGDL